jgi:hypothetical protein
MRRSLSLPILENGFPTTADEDAISLATSSVKDARPLLLVDPPPSSSNLIRRREEEEASTSPVKRQRIESIRVNDIHVSELAHTEMMEDSPFYKALFEGGETCISVNEISPMMLKTYINMFENKSMLKKFLFSDTRGYYEFIEFLDRISSKSLFTVIDVWADEIRFDGNKKVFMALENYQNEQKEETVLSLSEKAYLEKDFPYQKSSLLTPISYCFDDNVYIMLKIKVFMYTVLTSMNARWLYIHGSRILRLESVTKLERAVLALEMSEGCCVKWVDFPKEDNFDDGFNLLKTNIYYNNVEGHQENEEDSDVDDDSSCFTNVSEDFDRERVDGGKNFYYEGGMNFDGICGVVQHGRGEMVEYPIDERNRPQEVNRTGIYINNKIYCDIVYCYRSSKCICQCRRKVGEASSGDSDDEDEESDDEDEEDDSSKDYDRCAFNIHKKEFHTNMESDSEMSLQYCQPCAEKSKTFQDEEYLGRLFHAITDVTFSGEHSDMMSLLDRINPYTSLVREIETFEDYIQLVKPSEQVIRHWDDRLEEQIRFINKLL